MKTCTPLIRNKHFSKSYHLGDPVAPQNWLNENLYVILARCQGPWGLNAPRLEGAKLYQTLSMEPEGPKDRLCNGAKARRLEGPQARECPKAGNCTKSLQKT